MSRRKLTKLDRLLLRLGACAPARNYFRGKRPGPALLSAMKRSGWEAKRGWLLWLAECVRGIDHLDWTPVSLNLMNAEVRVASDALLDALSGGACRCSVECRRSRRRATRRTTWAVVRRLLVALRVLP